MNNKLPRRYFFFYTEDMRSGFTLQGKVKADHGKYGL
jgi:hypothetical protein